MIVCYASALSRSIKIDYSLRILIRNLKLPASVLLRPIFLLKLRQAVDKQGPEEWRGMNKIEHTRPNVRVFTPVS